jgi:hypothetical protein
MTKQHWAILGVLGLVVICVYCFGAVLVAQMLNDQFMTTWGKSQNVTAYRIEFDWTIKGNFADLPAGWNAAQGLPLLGIAGTINGKDSQMAFK